MKWTEKGNELATKYSEIKEKYVGKEVFIYGAGMIGGRIAEAIYALTDWDISCFFDRDINKKQFKNKEVKHWEDISESVCKGEALIIIGLPEDLGNQVRVQLINECGVRENQCVTYTQFVRYDFPIFSLYKYNKVFLDTISMIMTEACTLKCEKCAIMLPYFKEHRNPSLEKLKAEADALFEKVDFVGNFTVTGGEPLLRRELPELLKYVGENYRNKIGSLKIISNGMIEPWSELLDVLKAYDMAVDISDYTVGVPEIKDAVEKSLTCYKNAGITTYFLSSATWVDFGFETTDNRYSEEQLIKFFDYCHTRCRGYVDGKIRYCINAFFAAKAKEMEEDENNAFDILNMESNEENRRALVEFDMGYSEAGYLKMCQHCNGTVEINTHYIEVGVQCKNL